MTFKLGLDKEMGCSMAKMVTVIEERICERCKGTGENVPGQSCTDCKGTGRVKIEVMR